jgi:cyclic pyranopterin phosphate synthase
MPKEVFGKDYPFLDRHKLLSYEEISRLTRIFVSLGVTKVRVTGGEPLLRHEITHLVAMLAALPGLEDLTMTTNGLLLERWAQPLKDAGLQRITVSLDSLDGPTFAQMNGLGIGAEVVLRGIEASVAAGLSPVKVNAVVQRGVNHRQVVDLAGHFRGSGIVLRLIEYMDVGNTNQWQADQVETGAAIVERISRVFPLEPVDANYRGEVARRWRYRDGQGEIGVITSVSQPFCRDCTRARLSPEGHLYTCLFAGSGFDLRSLLRSGQSDRQIRHFLESIWRGRDDRYSELRFTSTQPRTKVEMSKIGG